jgi:lysophospholipase L1-like esterase
MHVVTRDAIAQIPRPIDKQGHLLNAHGAGVLFFRGTYYLFGEIKKGCTWLVPGQQWEDYRVPAGGVSCYASSDLKTWANRGVALAPVTGQPDNDLDTGRVIERPKVIYNALTKKFVMWMHVDKNDYSYSRLGVAVSDHPQGPYHYLNSYRPNGQMARDMTLFKDNDGKAYLVYSSEDNNTIQVCQLSNDYLSPGPVYRRILVGRRREAPAIFKAGKAYYLITSSCTGWSPNAATFAVADSPLGPWMEKKNPCAGPGADTTFGVQSTYVLPLNDHPRHFLFMADRWNKQDLEASTYCWLPFTMHNGHFTIRQQEEVVAQWRFASRPFAVVHTEMQVRCDTSDVHAFLRFYDAHDRLLLELKTGAFKMGETQKVGHYTMAPPGVTYLRYGVERTGGTKGEMRIDTHTIDMRPAGKMNAPKIDLNAYMRPFWQGDTVTDETVLLTSSRGAPATGRLLFQPEKILTVRNFSGDTTYHEGADYTLSGKALTRSAGSRMPFRTDSSFDTQRDLAWYNLQSQWVTVSYIHRDKWEGPVPASKETLLPHILAKLRARQPLTILAYGMSITRGLDVSGYDSVPPYMPTYLDLFVRDLRKIFKYDRIRMINAGLPGATVDWGAEYASTFINPVHPDLVILDFGMNDFWRLQPASFGDSIRAIIRKVRAANQATEFLLLSNIQFDPAYVLPSDKNKSFYVTNLEGYNEILQKMQTRGIADLDMTTLSGNLYERKAAKDCLANPLHPNDYLARWIAQGLVACLHHINY